MCTDKRKQAFDKNKDSWFVDCINKNYLKSYWVCCPKCNSRTKIKINYNSVLLKFPLYCSKCKEEIMVSIIKLKMVVSEKPDA